MRFPGFFIAFESAPKCGKSTLAALLKRRVEQQPNRSVLLNRGALSISPFSARVTETINRDIPYSTAFYWADAVFNTRDSIRPALQHAGNVVIQDRYDLSIVVYREVYGLSGDSMLLDEYLARDMVLHPDLTVFLQPDPGVVFERIRTDPKCSSVDRAFVENTDRFVLAQERYKHHLDRLGRNTLSLDTHVMNPEQCVTEIIERISEKP